MRCSRPRDLEQRLASGHSPGALAGIPVAVKDNLCTVDQPTTCASAILRDYRPPSDAAVVERIRAADGIILGKTNCDEFAMGASTENSSRGPTRHPTDPERVPGGSSGGSATAVAAGMAPLALGSDTGGSVRQPAAFCGLVGLRPTYGAVSRRGLIAFASSLDQVGPLARTSEDANLLLQVIAGPDTRDSTSHRDTLTRGSSEASTLQGLRVGWPAEYHPEGLEAPLQQALQRTREVLEDAGAEIVPLSLPLTKYAVPTYYLVVTSEASSNLSRYDGVRYGPRSAADDLEELYTATRGDGFGDEVKRRLMLGTFALSAGYYDAYYRKALQVRRKLAEEFRQAFEKVDVLLGPTAPGPAFGLGEKTTDPLELYLCDIFTAPASLAGLPAVSLPAPVEESELPRGIQLTGPAGSDYRLLEIGARLEEAW